HSCPPSLPAPRQRLRRFLSFFDVAGGAEPPHDRPPLVPQRRHAKHEPPIPAVGTPNTRFPSKPLPGRERRAPLFEFAIFRVQCVQPSSAAQLFGREAGVVTEAPVREIS